MYVVKSYAELTEYFRRIAEDHPDINYFIVGDDDKILSKDRSLLDYPVLWLEKPDVNWSMINDLSRTYTVSFVLLENAAIDDWAKEDDIYNKLLNITGQILQWMQEDSQSDLIKIDFRSITSNPINTYGHDNDNGWRTTIKIIGKEGQCAPACKRQNICPVGTLAKFSWDNATAGDFTALTIINETLPTDEAWTWEWVWSIDAGPSETSTSMIPSISGAGKHIYIQLKITSGDCVRYASAKLDNKLNCGESNPFVMDQKYC